MTQAIKPKFKVGQKLISPAGNQIEIIRHYSSMGTNMYHYKYKDGKEGYHALSECQLLKANNYPVS